jgi:hypothetical protein
MASAGASLERRLERLETVLRARRQPQITVVRLVDVEPDDELAQRLNGWEGRRSTFSDRALGRPRPPYRRSHCAGERLRDGAQRLRRSGEAKAGQTDHASAEGSGDSEE